MQQFYTLINRSTILGKINDYVSVLSAFENPIVFSLIFLIIIFLILFLAMRNAVLPRQKRMQIEKSAVEASNIRLMAIFAELDPDPVMRINDSGEIIFTNPAAKNKGLGEFKGKPISNVISSLNIEPAEFIKNNKELSFTFYFNEKYYSVLLQGISYLNIAQLYMHDINELKTKEAELQESQRELKEFSNYLQQTIESERKRISRELHDDIGQKMVLLKLSLQKDFSKLTDSEDSPELLRNSRLLDGIARDIKTIAHSLIPSTLEEIGLHSSLINLIETVELQSSIKGDLEFTDVERLNINLEISIYRIIQEAINNIVKYSRAKEYHIELTKKSDTLRLIISDDGIGFDLRKNKNKGMGIRNMTERAEMHKGAFKIISSPMEGTVIMINFPLGE